MLRSPAPWLWLLDFDAHGKALDASDSKTTQLTSALMAHFTEVHVMRGDDESLEAFRVANPEGWSPASAVRGTVRTHPWPPGTFDCIALHDALVRKGLSTPDLLAELQGLHHLLRPGGWLALTSPFPPRLRGRRLHGRGIPRARLSRLLRQANFRELRCFFVEPSVDDPNTVVPAFKAAIRARDTLEGVSGRRLWKRRAAVELGLPAALFSAYVLLARA